MKKWILVNKYHDTLDAQRRLGYRAKKYIMANWEKVQDWSQLIIHIHNGHPTPNNPNTIEDMHFRPEDFTFGKDKHVIIEANPVVSVTNAVYDEYDGDFSITINGLQWWWLNDLNVCELADFICHETGIEYEEDLKYDEGFIKYLKENFVERYCHYVSKEEINDGMVENDLSQYDIEEIIEKYKEQLNG